MSESDQSSFEIESGFFTKLVDKHHSRTLGKSDMYTATLNSINTLVGSGLLVLPFALYHSGLILGTITIILTLVFGLYSTGLLIQCKNIAGVDSYSAIGHACYGRKSIFLVAGINTVL